MAEQGPKATAESPLGVEAMPQVALFYKVNTLICLIFYGGTDLLTSTRGIVGKKASHTSGCRALTHACLSRRPFIRTRPEPSAPVVMSAACVPTCLSATGYDWKPPTTSPGRAGWAT